MKINNNRMYKKTWGIRKKVTTLFEFITNNKKYHNKVFRSSYYKYLNKNPINRK